MSVARIPFSTEDEGVLRQLSGWMLFIAIVHFVGAGLLLLGGCCVLVGGSSVLAGASSMGPGAELGMGMGALFVVIAAFMAVLTAILIFQGVLLVQARSDFNQVVQSDVSDQAYLTSAFRRLKLFFLIEVALGVLGLLSNGGQIAMGLMGAV